MAAVVPLLPAKAREGARDWLLLRRQCCTVDAAVVSHERFRTITMATAVLRRRPRDMRHAHLRLVPSSSASLAPDSRSRSAVMRPQLLWLRTKQMLQWWMTVPLNSSSSLIICYLDRLIFYFLFLYKSTLCSVLDDSFDCLSLHFDFRSRRPCPLTSAFVVLILYCFSTVSIPAVPKEACKPSTQ